MDQRKLYVGLDIRDDITQIAVLGPGAMEPELLCIEPDTTRVETAVSIPGTKNRMEHFLDKIFRQEPIVVEGKECDPVNVLGVFLRKTLSLTKRRFPGETIRQIVVTTEYRDFRLIHTIYRALEKLGIEKDRAMVIDRRQSYVYYVLNQRKEFWVNQVGMFDYQDDRISYYQMQTDRFKRPMLVTVEERDYSDYLDMFQGQESKPEEKAAIFEGMVHGAIHGQIITSLFMTGDGFADGFADEVMKKLCVGRHLFQGDNLYVSGACYCARELGGGRKMDDFLYLDEDTIASHIVMQVYTDAKVQEIVLARAGTPWYQIDREVDLIPDGDEELEVQVKNAVTKETMTHLIPMDGIRARIMRRVRVGIQVRFAGPNACIVTVRDKGFGNLFPSSHRIWEETITI